MNPRSLLKPVWAAVDQVRRLSPGVTILLYHRVGAGTRSEVDMPTDRFRDQMAELRDTTDVVSLATALDHLTADAPPLIRPMVVVTFDDGTEDFVRNAVPVLADAGVPCTLYAATRWIDDGQPFWGDGAGLTWSALRDAVASGVVAVGSHTHNHVLLDRLEPAAIGEELDRSIQRITDEIGVAPADFAYPKALPPSPSAAAAVAARFRSAALAGTRANVPGRTDPQRLSRSPVQNSDGMRWWRHKVAGGMGAEDAVRDRLNAVRYAGRRS